MAFLYFRGISDKNTKASFSSFSSILFNKYGIWANFSGYTDIARGIGKFFGLEMTENFKRPFNSVTIKEYWKKWHISLSVWIRDYVFYPLVSSPLSKFGVYFLILITFIVFGLWHDLKVKFIIYGAIQALLIFLSDRITPTVEKIISKIKSIQIKNLITFFRKIWLYIVLVSLPSVFFTANDVGSAIAIFKNLFIYDKLRNEIYLKILFRGALPATLLIFVVEYIESLRAKYDFPEKLVKMNYFLEVIFYFSIVLILLYFMFEFNFYD